MLAIFLGQERNHLKEYDRKKLVDELTKLPDLLGRTLEISDQIEKIADQFHSYSDFLFLGRGINYPIAMEGALKLKEISYIHAEGYPAAELKHGPIALIDKEMPAIVICTKSKEYEKMISNIQEIKSRKAITIGIIDEKNIEVKNIVDHHIIVPTTKADFSPIINIIPLQLLAYFTAKLRGCDVDKPRNLAKSVTVE